MSKSLLFIPDISGFTKFVQTTEVAHSQHVIAELLEILISANTQDLKLAEIEGDALFFYKENNVPSQEKLLAQIETMFTAFYSHLKLLETNRICPCNACASAPNLELKVVAHCGELQFLKVQHSRKPFGESVIEAHRLLKNSVESDNYALISEVLADEIHLSVNYKSKFYHFERNSEVYDGNEVPYIFSEIDETKLKLNFFNQPLEVVQDKPPNIVLNKQFPVSAETLIEYITNYRYRHHWVKGVDGFEFDENEVTRVGTEHVCVINHKNFDFVTVSKEVEKGQYVYGEMTTSPPLLDKLYQFYIITPIDKKSSKLTVEIYLKGASILKKILIGLLAKRIFEKQTRQAIEHLFTFSKKTQPVTPKA